jgi:hypothetical protein
MSDRFLSNLRSIRGATITEYTQLTPTTAKVIASIIGDLSPEEFCDRMTAALKNEAAPIRASFRWLDKGRSMIGFVTAVPPVRAYDANTVEAKYRKITANTFMDKSDESIWEVKPGSGGSYLTRKANDNLAELIEAARVSPRGSTARMYQVVQASVNKGELLAYVDGNSNQVHYGFCMEASADESYKVLSHTTNEVETVPTAHIVAAYEIDIPKNITAAITPADKKNSIDYYKKLYFYDPAYLEKVIREIEETAAA